MRRFASAFLPGLDGRALQDLEALSRAAEQRELRRGEILMRQGEPSNVLYFVVSGRFSVHLQGVAEPIAEIAQGQPIGEIGFFAGLPRTATIKALRDSCVLFITRERFDELSKSCPGIRDAVIVSLAHRLSESHSVAMGSPTSIRTVALVTAGGRHALPQFVAAMREVFGARAHSIFLTEKDIVGHISGCSLDDPATSRWLNELEGESEFVFYIGDPALTEWTKKCIRQADAVILVGAAGASVELNSCELFAFSIHQPSARRLVILHEARAGIASGTSSWLRSRDVLMHHHITLQDTRDVERLFRFLSGEAVGFVAGAGGALGYAHLGVYKAFCEAGADFDILGGTSMGAAMTAGLALGAEPEQVNEVARKMFLSSGAFRRLTLPFYSLFNHKVLDQALRSEYLGIVIEDLWKPYFAISSNMSDRKARIHRRGPVWHAIRASMSVPGALPPFFTERGEMLVDGAIMDNVPLAPMKALKSGPNVVVALGLWEPRQYDVDYDSIPGPLALAATVLNPFRRLPQVPTIYQVIMLSLFADGHTDLQPGESDILIKPELPEDVHLNSFERHNEIFQHSYRKVRTWLDARIAADDPRIRGVIGTTRTGANQGPAAEPIQ